jgi:TonB family protein
VLYHGNRSTVHQPQPAMNPIGFSARRVVTGGILLLASFSPAFAARSDSLEIRQTVEPRFPSVLVTQNITSGEAWVMITVGEDGKLTDALPTRYTHHAFADEALRVLNRWQYTAPRVNGHAIPVRAEVYFSFEATGTVVSLDFNGTVQSLTSFARKPVYVQKLCPPMDLDQPPTAVHTVSPPLPAKSEGAGTLIDFIIDESGRARMPVLVSSPHTDFAENAANALSQWQFTPPTRRGEPVAVRVRQEFVLPNDS